MTRPKRAVRISLKDVAHAAGVSIGVASQVLSSGRGNSRTSEATAERIRHSALKLGYRPNVAARCLRGDRSHLYGVMAASAGDPLVSFLVQQLDVESTRVGAHTVMCNTRNDQFDNQMTELTYLGVDGVFCVVHDWFEGDRAALVKRHPHTVFYEDPGLRDACHVTIDREEIGRLAVRHLASIGRKRIGIALRGLSLPTQAARLRGYRSELAALGLATDDRLVFNAEPFGLAAAIHDPATEQWRFPEWIVEKSIDALVRDGAADGIIVHDDFWASIMLRMMRSRGIRVPDDVAVVGYLNHYLSDWTDPPLTTISRRPDEAARMMVMLMERLANGDRISSQGERVITIRPQLIVRKSA